jgi:thiaminase
MKLTEHLLSLDTDSFKKATEHEFLKQVGRFDVKPEHLKAWIIQDRFYTGGYVNMMGAMVSRLALFEDQRELGDNDPSYSVQRNQGILKTLSFAFSKVCREANYFTEFLNKPCYNTGQPAKKSEETSSYIEYLTGLAGINSSDLGEALVLLWTIDMTFFTACNYAKSISSDRKADDNDPHVQSCRTLMNDRTTSEYKEYVEECARHVDQLSTDDPDRLANFETVFRCCLIQQHDILRTMYS